jgi:predicted ATPase
VLTDRDYTILALLRVYTLETGQAGVGGDTSAEAAAAAAKVNVKGGKDKDGDKQRAGKTSRKGRFHRERSVVGLS